ncbi:hypothetical protein ACFV16_07915 [Streptomyces massasporeus]
MNRRALLALALISAAGLAATACGDPTAQHPGSDDAEGTAVDPTATSW